jgi:cytochrome c biogenesis factor
MPDIGGFSLRFALVIALLGFGSAIYAGVQRRPEWTRVAERSVWLVFAFVSVAMIALFYAFATFDFQLF